MAANTTHMDSTVELTTNIWSLSPFARKSTSENMPSTPGNKITTGVSAFNNNTVVSEISSPVGLDSSTTLLSRDNTTYYGNQSYGNNGTTLNISDEERDNYLTLLQEQTTIVMVPAMMYLIILATVGLIGNSLVLFVYSRKFKRTSTRIFIMALASFDIVSNVVSIPGEIYHMFNFWDFKQPMLCKTRLFVNASTTMVSTVILVAVTVVRYRKICKPFQTQVSIKLSKIISITLAVASLTLSVPYAIINGRQTKKTPRPGIYGYECNIDDSYKHTIWPFINGALFLLIFVACCIPLVVMYIFIGVTAWRHCKVHGVIAYSTSSHEQPANDSSNSNGVNTQSTDDKPLKFTKTQKTRSFVKMKSDPSSRKPSGSSQKVGDKNNHCFDNQYQENQGSKDIYKSRDDDCEDDVDGIEYLNDSTVTAKSKTLTSMRTMRSATGEKVNINVLMVKELTVKLRAVKKQAESRTSENDVSNSNHYWKDDSDENALMSTEKSNEDVNEKSKILDKNKVDIFNKENTKNLFKKKFHKNKSADYNLCTENKQELQSYYRTRFSKSLDDLSRLTSTQNLSKEMTKFKAAENEDLDLRGDTKSLIDHEHATNKDESELSKDEPLSEFARAMQWVDLTYYLREDQKENENTKNETNGEEIDTNSLSKKGSFALGRKISRDNSFLQRHRKLKDALTDTLTRARKNRRERGASETEGKDSNGNGTLENINSESENTCNDDNTDRTCQEQEIKDIKATQANEHNDIKRRASRVKEGMNSNESDKKIKLNIHGAKRRGIGRTTFMLILISAVYILGFVPFFGMLFAEYAMAEGASELSMTQQALFHFFLRSYFLNSAANPIIYSLCDINFRRECFNLLKCR